MNKHITLLQNNQDSHKSFPDVSFFFNLHFRKQELLNILFHLDRKYKGVVFISQRKLAALLSITREWANKLIAYLVNYKILSIEHNRNHSNYYILSNHFRSLNFCKSISKIFKNLYIPAVFLTFSEAAPTAVSQREFTHTNVNYLYNKRKRITYNQSTKKIGEAVMKNEFSLALREIKSISLTEAGMAILSAFPDEALRNTDVETRNIKNLRNPFGFFYARCKKYCIDKNLLPDWELQRTLSYQYEIRADTPMIFERKEYIASEASANAPKQESRKPAQKWSQPESKRFSMQKKELPYFDGEPQSRSNFRAMLRAYNALINDNEPLPYRGIWPLISREKSDKSYEEFLKGRNVSASIAQAIKYTNFKVDEPPVTDYSAYDEDLNDIIIDL